MDMKGENDHIRVGRGGGEVCVLLIFGMKDEGGGGGGAGI